MKLILIGGTPRTGKTTLAQKIAEELGVSWMSTDALEAIAHRYTPPDLAAKSFPKSEMRKATEYSNDAFYDTYSTNEIVESYSKQAKTTSEAIESLAEYASKEDWGYVIEGYHVTPLLLAKFETRR